MQDHTTKVTSAGGQILLTAEKNEARGFATPVFHDGASAARKLERDGYLRGSAAYGYQTTEKGRAWLVGYQIATHAAAACRADDTEAARTMLAECVGLLYLVSRKAATGIVALIVANNETISRAVRITTGRN